MGSLRACQAPRHPQGPRHRLHPAVAAALQRTSPTPSRHLSQAPLHRPAAAQARTRRLHEPKRSHAPVPPGYELRPPACKSGTAAMIRRLAPHVSAMNHAAAQGCKPCHTRASRLCPVTPPAFAQPRSRSRRFEPETPRFQGTLLIRQSVRQRLMRPGHAARLRLVAHAAPPCNRALMLLDDVADRRASTRAHGHIVRSRAFVATCGMACPRRVSTQQRSPAGMPRAAPPGPRRPRGATRKPLWHNGSRWPGPPFAYARHAVPQSWLPQCRRNARWH